MRYQRFPTWALVPALLLAAGCGTEQAQEQAQAPLVTVARPAVETVPPDDVIFEGRTVPPRTVGITAHVTGYLDKVLFKDGDEVEKDAPLYEIDKRQYQSNLDRAEGQVTQLKARITRLEAEFKRAQKLVSTGTISREEYDKTVGDKAEAEAGLAAAKANVAGNKLDLDFCTIAAPWAGRISRTLVDPGNLVKADTTVLTNMVVVDPAWAKFDISEGIMLRIQRLVREGKVKAAEGDNIPVYLGTSDEKDFPHKGTLNFIDNQVNPSTGTLLARATFPNPRVNAKGEPDPKGNRVLSPGLFVRIRVPIGEPYQAVLVAERALLSDQGQRYVYVVQDGKPVRRLVDIGSLKEGLRVILPVVKKEDGTIARGLEPSDLVVVNGVQRVRAGQPVRHEDPVPMASMTAGADAEKPAVTTKANH